MTLVKVKRQNGKIISFSCDGHTDYGLEGEDIVCAALSSIVQTAVLGLMQVAGINVDFKVKHEEGILELALPKELTDAERNNADMILETMFLGIADLTTEYGKYIKLEVQT